MGEPLNVSGDLVPPEEMYEACRVMSRHVVHKGGLEWDFSRLHTVPIDPEFTRLIESYLSSVLNSDAENKGWKIPETTLVYPWIVRMFPYIHYIHWVRDPKDSIIGTHVTDDLSDFDIPYEKTEDVRLRRAISWKYQREIVKATPVPEKVCHVRFEDFVMQQDTEIKRVEEFLGIRLAKIEVRKNPVGRWKTDDGVHYFDFLEEDLKDLGYEIPEE